MEKRIILGAVSILIAVFLVGLVFAEKLNIEVGNSYAPGEDVVFKVVLYDDDSNRMAGQVNFIVQNYYSDIIKQGSASSGEEIVFKLPEGTPPHPWKISANYNEIKAVPILFTVEKLEKAEIKLEGDILMVGNIGNSVYDKDILIYIGDADQTARVHLEVGQTKKIRLTAPDGEYKVRVVSEDQNFEANSVKLTGNVIGLERVFAESFWKKYPMVSLFLGALLLVIVVVGVLKFRNRGK